MEKFKKNLKFILYCIGLMFLGGIVGTLISSLSIDKLLFNSLENLQDFIDSKIYPIYFIFVLVINLLILIFYIIGKRKIERALRSDEDIIDEDYLYISLSLTPIGVVGDVILLLNLFKVNLEKEFSPRMFALASILIVVSILYIAYMQYTIFKFMKSYNPKSYDKVLDIKFSKKYLENMDERERLQTYKASYYAYNNTMKTVLVLIIVLGILAAGMGTSLLPVYILGLVFMVGSLTYLLEYLKN